MDEIGVEFSSVEAAYLNGYDAMLEIAFEKLRLRQDPAEDAFEIMDGEGHMLMHVPVSEVLRPRRPTGTPAVYLGRQIIAACEQQLARSQTLRAELRAEFKKTRSALETVQANLARLRSVTQQGPPQASG
ncbi:MAG: hypothetical protein WCB02_35225 [Bradyrhizobium sp.]